MMFHGSADFFAAFVLARAFLHAFLRFGETAANAKLVMKNRRKSEQRL